MFLRTVIIMKNLRSSKGFTMTEVMFVAVISIVVIGVIISAWVFTYRTWTLEGRRMMLRIDLLKALETIQSDTRLSSATYMSFYPSTSTTGEYTAVSMPLAKTDSNGLLTLDANKKIVWDKTVIYFIFNEAGGTKTLRRTVIDPRDNGLDQDEIYQQLADVVAAGAGGEGSTTDDGFLKNLDDFKMKTVPAIINFYEDSVDPVRVGKFIFGWARLDAGEHTIRFETTGKDEDSTGYGMGLDHIMIAPSGSKREVEYYNSSFAPVGSISSSGKTVARVYNTMWSNYNYLDYAATGTGDYIEFTDDYDLWRDSSFDDSSRNNTMYWGEELRVKLELPEDRETGTEDVTWYAYLGAGDSQTEGRDGDLPGYPITIRTIVANANIDSEGDLIRVKFRSSTNNPLKIATAYITRRNSGSDGLANQSTGALPISQYHRHQQIFFKDTYDSDGDGNTTDIVPSVFIPPDSEVWSEWTAFPLVLSSGGTNYSYFVTFCVPDLESVTFPSGWSGFDPFSSDAKYWQGTSTKSYYVAAGDYTTQILPAAGTPLWTGSYTAVSSNNIYISAEIDVWSKTGTVESEIFDTGLDDPAYNQVKWSEAAPADTEVLMKTRSSDSQFMTGEPDWSAIAGSTSNPTNLSVGTGRYVQFQATLSAQPFWTAGANVLNYANYVDEQVGYSDDYSFPMRGGEYLVTGLYSTWADDVQIDWPGDDRIYLVSGYIARKNDYGEAKMTIDGLDIIKVLGVDLGVSETFQDKVIEESLSVEVEPRNTGR